MLWEGGRPVLKIMARAMRISRRAGWSSFLYPSATGRKTGRMKLSERARRL